MTRPGPLATPKGAGFPQGRRGAALVPLALAGAAKLAYKRVFAILKKLAVLQGQNPINLTGFVV